VGTDNVTATMKSLGCEHTKLQRRMMDTEAAARGQDNISTPAEAARLMRLMAEGKFVSRKVSEHALAILRKAKPGDIKSVLPEEVPVAFKPGAVPGVMTEWALVGLKGRTYIVVVMGSFQVKDEFKQAMKDVSQTAYDFFLRAGATKYGAYIDPEEWAKH
jgi:beta-lactamase class A